ncbi:MAG: molybdopterin biosynthesis protein [Thermodesulfobacteriota bacterium]
MERQRIYLKMKDAAEALEIFITAFKPSPLGEKEEIVVQESPGRITAEPVFARMSSPLYPSAAMDGIAVSAQDTYGATERSPKRLTVGKQAWWLNTGQVMPEGTNAVIMVEKLHQVDNKDTIEIFSAAFPWQNVRKVGEDFVATELLFPQNHRIRALDLGTLIEGGIFRITVRRRPRIRVIPTGSELVDFSSLSKLSDLNRGEIIESNSYVLASLIAECGAEPVVENIVEDRVEDIKDSLIAAANSDADIVLLIAGSSAGRRDYTAQVIEDIGELLVHGVTIMPGKPTILGRVEGKPVVGIPGYPVSAYIAFQEFVKPYLFKLQGLIAPKEHSVPVVAGRDMPSKLGVEEFIRVNIGSIGGRLVAIPLPRGAGLLTTLSRAEGMIKTSSRSEGVAAGEEVEAALLVEPEELANTVMIIGSHDIALDILSDELKKSRSPIRIASGNVGSLGGLMALRKGTAHVAGSHLLDTETGVYNVSYIERYLQGLPVHVFHLVLREQGMIVRAKNPKAIRGVEDLTRDDVSFINRQLGSGTRILLDYKLDELGIDPSQINGYENEEYTHMNVAVAVLSGLADAGLGILAAARALNLDFIPLAREQYDLVIPSSFVDDPKIEILLNVIRSEEFKERIKGLGGYDPENSGNLWKVI